MWYAPLRQKPLHGRPQRQTCAISGQCKALAASPGRPARLPPLRRGSIRKRGGEKAPVLTPDDIATTDCRPTTTRKLVIVSGIKAVVAAQLFTRLNMLERDNPDRLRRVFHPTVGI